MIDRKVFKLLEDFEVILIPKKLLEKSGMNLEEIGRAVLDCYMGVKEGDEEDDS